MTCWEKHSTSPNHGSIIDTHGQLSQVPVTYASLLGVLWWDWGGCFLFIEKGSHSLCSTRAGLELMVIPSAGITAVSHHTQLRVSLLTGLLLILFGFLWKGSICKRQER